MKGPIEAKFQLKQNFANNEQNQNRISTWATTDSLGGVGELHSKLEHPAGCSSYYAVLHLYCSMSIKGEICTHFVDMSMSDATSHQRERNRLDYALN